MKVTRKKKSTSFGRSRKGLELKDMKKGWLEEAFDRGSRG